MPAIRTLTLLALTTALAVPVAAQDLTSDCAFDELSGPAETVQTRRALYEPGDGQLTLGPATTRRFDDFDEECNYTSRTLYDDGSEVHWEYWPDEEGRGQRLRTWTIDRVGTPPPPPGPPPPGFSEVPERERGTRIETVLSPDSTRIFEREITNGVLQKDWTHTLDDERRLVHSLMLDGAGQPRHRMEREYAGREAISTYAWIPTREYPSSNSTWRERTVDEEVDARGNWTRRTVYEWTAAERWEPKEVLTRAITYR